MFAFVRFLLLAVIVLAVVLFIQPNLLKELGLQLPEEETDVTTAPQAIEEREESTGAEAPAEEALTESLPASDTPVSEDAPASAGPAAGPPPATAPETPADMPEPAQSVGEDAEAPAVAAPADEPVPAFEPVGESDTRQEVPAVAEPASEASATEGMTGTGEEMENALQPAELPGESLTDTPAPAFLNEDAPPAFVTQPVFPEEAELPVEPANVEEPPSPAETMEEAGFDTNQTPESPQQEPVDAQPPPDETAPGESAAEADEIPTAGSPELQRVLENIDRTFNN